MILVAEQCRARQQPAVPQLLLLLLLPGNCVPPPALQPGSPPTIRLTSESALVTVRVRAMGRTACWRCTCRQAKGGQSAAGEGTALCAATAACRPPARRAAGGRRCAAGPLKRRLPNARASGRRQGRREGRGGRGPTPHLQPQNPQCCDLRRSGCHTPCRHPKTASLAAGRLPQSPQGLTFTANALFCTLMLIVAEAMAAGWLCVSLRFTRVG